MAGKPIQTRNCLAENGRAFRRKLVAWYADNAKDYAWRRTRDPYAILVSELMLQQTRITTVLEGRYYERWMQRFPDTRTLAAANEEEVLKCWEGLGYYSRARNLHTAARIIEEDLEGQFPGEAINIERLLPGVGPYTAGAVASFAFDEPAAIVDGNVARVLARMFDLREAVDGKGGSELVWGLARRLMPKRRKVNSREYNSALMELGQTICKHASPLCRSCPVASFCATRDPELLPIKKPRQRPVPIEENVLFYLRNGTILLEQEKGTRRRGLWKLPELDQEKSTTQLSKLGKPILTLKYSITKYRVTMNVYQAPVREPGAGRQWIALDELDEISLGAPYRRALMKLVQKEGSRSR